MGCFYGAGGVVFVGDDFYQISSGLIVLETTIGNGNQSLFTEYTTPTCVLEYTRNIVANRLATYVAPCILSLLLYLCSMWSLVAIVIAVRNF